MNRAQRRGVKMPKNNGHYLAGVPLIGGTKPRAGVGFAALVRGLDANGTYEPESEGRGPDGQPVVTAGRDRFVDAEELVDMIRQVVREELERLPRV